MHTVELLEQAIALAGRNGFVVRQEWLNGSAAGTCQFNGRHWIFVDLAQSPREQLDQVLDALSQPACLAYIHTEPKLQSLLKLRKAA